MRLTCGVATAMALLAPGVIVREARALDLAARIEQGDPGAFDEAASAPGLAPCVEDALLAQGSWRALDALHTAGGPRASAALRERSRDARDEYGEWQRTDDSEVANMIDERLARSSWWERLTR